MPLLDAALRGVLIALLFLVAALLLRDRPTLALARVVVVFSIGLVVQVTASLPAIEATMPRLWQAPLVGISVGNAVLFWIFVQALFDDEFALRPWHVMAWGVVAAASAFNCATGWNTASAIGRIAVGLQRGAPLLFAVLAAAAAASTWDLDLVEKRRRLRKFIVVAGVAYTVVMLCVRLASPGGRLPGIASTLDTAALLAIVAVVAFGMLRVATSDLFPQGRTSVPPMRIDAGTGIASDGIADSRTEGEASTVSPDPADERLAEALQRMMRDERAYQAEGLTVLGLANRLGVPEYRLRRVINRQLGHRNFNVFVNSFRLEEARTALADPDRRALPVLTIALEAGFQSIGPFNRAFKQQTGLTPSEFRRQSIADS